MIELNAQTNIVNRGESRNQYIVIAMRKCIGMILYEKPGCSENSEVEI